MMMNPDAMTHAMMVVVGECLRDAAESGSHGDQRQKSLLHDEFFHMGLSQSFDASKAALRKAETAVWLMRG